jgi:hypothetical protein
MRFTSFKNGVSTPGALNIEFDIPVVTADIPAGNAMLKIWGLDLSILNKAALLNYKNITIRAGMKNGLPLANEQANASPSRNGIIFQGSIFQAFGNWQGTEQSLDLVITTQLVARPQDEPKRALPLIFSCAKGQSFSEAISQAMQAAGIVSTIEISGSIVATEPIIFRADTLGSFAQTLDAQSRRMSGDPLYLGIKMVKSIDGYDFTDNTSQKSGVQVKFNDLIGQPAWQDFSTVQMKVVMRSDIHVADTVIMPQSNTLTTARAFSNLKEGIAYAGSGWVKSVRHIGNFRQPDANSWVSVIDVLMNTSAQGA